MIAKIATFAAISGVIYLVIALALIASQRPQALPEREGLHFDKIIGGGGKLPKSEAFSEESFRARDGAELRYAHVKPEPASELPLLIMLHGSGWYHGQFEELAWALRDVAEIKALTLRGHGQGPDSVGDVEYVGQLEDDIADLIGETDRKVIVLGHSSGGGLAVRFAGGANGQMADGMILLAPFLKHNAPTTRPNSGGWAFPLTRRIIGLSMLNNIGIKALDYLPIIQFNVPRVVLDGPMGQHATTAYSWRLNQSYAPRNDYLGDVAKLPDFLLIAGREDEAFDAEGYEPLMRSVTDKGRYVIVDGASHLDIVDHAATEDLIREYLSEFR